MSIVQTSLTDLFLGAVIGAALWGVSCAQAWHYFSSHPRDPAIIKCMAGAILVFDTAHEALVVQALYEYTVEHFGNIFFLLTIPRSSAATLVLARLTGIISQGFYVWKIWRLSNRRWSFALPVVIPYVAVTALSIAQTVVIARSDTWDELLRNSRPLPALAYAADLTTDAIIAVLMSFFLTRDRSEYAHPTRLTLSRLLVFTLSTNTLTGICALLIMITSTVWPDRLTFLPFFYIIVRLNTNSFLAALNLRPFFAGRATESEHELSLVPMHPDQRLHIDVSLATVNRQAASEHKPGLHA